MNALRPHQEPVWRGPTGVIEEESGEYWFYPAFPQSHNGVIRPHDLAQGPYPTLDAAIRHAKRGHHGLS